MLTVWEGLQLLAITQVQCLQLAALPNACKMKVHRLYSKAKGLLPKAFGEQVLSK